MFFLADSEYNPQLPSASSAVDAVQGKTRSWLMVGALVAGGMILLSAFSKKRRTR